MVQRLKERGYVVKENVPVYYTMNMDKTAKWFEEVLGWYAGIDERNENGEGLYGCVLPLPNEIHNMALFPFNGFHMFFGEPTEQTVAFMRVDNINSLYSFVKNKAGHRLVKLQHSLGVGKNVMLQQLTEVR